MADTTQKAEPFDPRSLLQILSDAPPDGRFLLALSGGVDSMVLLDGLAAVREQLSPAELVAVHINHQLHPDAEAWATLCEQACRERGVTYLQVTVSVDHTSGKGPEASARKARYEALADLMEPGDVLLSAHHADDQAETLLINLMRGSGLRGLAGMPQRRVFGPGWLVRPLLGVTRQQLLRYAESQKLIWVEDPSNSDETLDRNFLRHSVIPMLQQRWPAAGNTIATSASLLQEADSFLESELEMRLDSLVDGQGYLVISKLLVQPVPLQPLLLRHWCHRYDYPMLPRRQMRELLQQLRSGIDRQPRFEWEGAFAGRDGDRLLVHRPLPPHDASWQVSWDGAKALQLPSGLGTLKSVGDSRHVQRTVAFRNGGETLLQGGMHRQLKTIFQQLGIPVWLRDRVPLLFENGELVAVADLFAGDLFRGMRLQWQPGSGWPLAKQ